MIIRIGSAVARRLLALYPPAFRDRHGEQMLAVLVERGRDAAGVGARVRYWVGALLDLAGNGVAVRFDEWRERRRMAGTPSAMARRGDERGGGMDSLLKDFRYAARTLIKSPGFTIVAVLTIGMGIGANTAIFSVVRTVLLAPLPYEDPGELVLLWGEMRNRGVTNFPLSPPDFAAYRDGAESLDDLAAIFTFPVSITGDGDPVEVDAASVTTNFFDLLGLEPVLGRSFVDADGVPQPQAAPGQASTVPAMVMLSHALWQQRYAGDPDVIGRTIDVGGGPSEIVGVLPASFEMLLPPGSGLQPDAELWIAARIDYVNSPENNVFLRPVGRLRVGATKEQLQSQIDRIASDLASRNQLKATAGYAMRVESLQDDLTAGVRPVLMALFGAVVFVLLIACANVSNLLLVRASGRDRELAVRAAMGGSRARLVRQMMIESGLLAGAGAVVGLILASAGISLLLTLRPENLPRIGDVHIDGLVLAFTFTAAALASLAFGVLPAVQGSGFDLASALKERGSAGSNAARRLVRNGVVIVEVALSVVLLIGAGLMVRSFVELTHVSPGFEADGVLTFTANPPFAKYPQPIDRANYFAELQRKIDMVPGVERAASTIALPLTGALFNGRYGGEEALTDPEAFGQAAYRSISPGYFEAMGTRLLAGRTFSDADMADSSLVAVVDDKLAEILWPGESAIGKRFLIRAITLEAEWVEVVGVVERQRSDDLAADGPETVYFTDRYFGSFGGSWVVKSSVDPMSLVPAIRTAVQELDSDVPLADIELMQTYVDRARGPTRFALTLIGIFGVVALLLASIGLYGVLSYVVRQRTAEIGVRMAFGAETGNILRLVVGQGLALAVGGVVVGLLIAWPVTGIMESLLVGVTPTDPVTFAAISGIFLLVATAACYIPARRASHVDPLAALREE